MKLSDRAAYELLKKYRICVACHGFAKSLEHAEFIADNFSFPLVLKVDSPDIIHKLSSGCVKFAYSKEEFAKKYYELLANAKKITKKVDGVIIQEFVTGIETIVGAKQDEQFGHVIMFGSGGIHTEIFKDVSFRLIPIKERDAHSMLNETKISSLLPNKPSIADVLVKVSRLVQENPDIKEFDINPLFVAPDKVLAADARVIFEKPLN